MPFNTAGGGGSGAPVAPAPARPLLSIGTLALMSAADMPTALTLQQTTSGAPQTLSDGTRVWQGSGIVAADFTVSVLLYTEDASGTPRNKLDALKFMQESRRRYPFTWPPYYFPVEVVDVKETWQGLNGDLAVDVALFRPAAGALVAATIPAPATRASASLERVRALAPAVGPRTQDSMQTLLTARARAGR